jgi:hypothetical protein
MSTLRIDETNFDDLNALVKENPHVKEIVITGINDLLTNVMAGKPANLDLGPLAKCESLETLILEGNRQRVLDLTPLSGIKSLKKIVLDRTPSVGFRESPAKPIDFSPLLGTSLEWLEIISVSIHTLDLSPLGEIPTLKFLEISATSIRTLELATLRDSEIETLVISQNLGLVNYNLEHLTGCKRLRKLIFGRVGKKTLFGGIDISPLVGCEHLEDVLVFGKPIVFIDNEEDIPPVIRDLDKLIVLPTSKREREKEMLSHLKAGTEDPKIKRDKEQTRKEIIRIIEGTLKDKEDEEPTYYL